MTVDPKPTRSIQLLGTLRDHPFLSREQLQMILGWRKRTVQWNLEKLVKAKLIRLVNGRQPNVAARSLYVLSRAGLDHLAWDQGMPLASYVETYRYHSARLERLILVVDRVFLIRSFLLQLRNANWDWSVADWDVEVELEFSTMKYALPFACHGIARLMDAQGYWITLVVEFDLGKASVRSERTRLARLVEGSQDARFFDSERATFPILVILAANEDRLNDYDMLLSRLMGVEYEQPHAFMTTRQSWMKSNLDPAASIWKTEQIDGGWVSLFADIEGGSEHPANYLPWERLPRRRRFSEHAIELVPLEPGTLIEHKRSQLAALSLALHALDKSLLALIGDFPLLDAVEMAQIKEMPVRSVRRALKRLQRWELIEARWRPQRLQKAVKQQSRAERQRAKAHCYVLTEKGLWLLTAWAGLGMSVETYARVRGWKKRFWELVYHWEHTRIENAIHIQFLREARRRGHRIHSWLSELESRIYFDTSYENHSGQMYRQTRRPRKRKYASNPMPYGDWGSETGARTRKDFSRMLAWRGHQLKSFLPDGLGVYETEEQSFTIAVEVDRTRAKLLPCNDLRQRVTVEEFQSKVAGDQSENKENIIRYPALPKNREAALQFERELLLQITEFASSIGDEHWKKRLWFAIAKALLQLVERQTNSGRLRTLNPRDALNMVLTTYAEAIRLLDELLESLDVKKGQPLPEVPFSGQHGSSRRTDKALIQEIMSMFEQLPNLALRNPADAPAWIRYYIGNSSDPFAEFRTSMKQGEITLILFTRRHQLDDPENLISGHTEDEKGWIIRKQELSNTAALDALIKTAHRLASGKD